MGHPPSDIFGKPRLTPNQLRAVAERRFDDAMCLYNSGDRGRLNGAMYMGGFTIECLLKALLLERHRGLQRVLDPAKLSKSERRIYGLLFGHDLDQMLNTLLDIRVKLEMAGEQVGAPVWRKLRDVCEVWTVYARYSSKLASREAAERFLGNIREVKQWLRKL